MSTLKQISTYEEAYAVALIRNECCQWMTNDTSVLNVERQLKFFREIMARNDTWVLLMRERDVPCGYGIVKINRHERSACLTGGLAEPFRGKALGQWLFEIMIARALRDGIRKPWLTVLRSNTRAVRLYFKIGFKITKATKRIYTMEYRP
jgi:ribosomal protein S18 acetylase RimI-like enzyme